MKEFSPFFFCRHFDAIEQFIRKQICAADLLRVFGKLYKLVIYFYPISLVIVNLQLIQSYLWIIFFSEMLFKKHHIFDKLHSCVFNGTHKLFPPWVLASIFIFIFFTFVDLQYNILGC